MRVCNFLGLRTSCPHLLRDHTNRLNATSSGWTHQPIKRMLWKDNGQEKKEGSMLNSMRLSARPCFEHFNETLKRLACCDHIISCRLSLRSVCDAIYHHVTCLSATKPSPIQATSLPRGPSPVWPLLMASARKAPITLTNYIKRHKCVRWMTQITAWLITQPCLRSLYHVLLSPLYRLFHYSLITYLRIMNI
jgi:hypothetical protein